MPHAGDPRHRDVRNREVDALAHLRERGFAVVDTDEPGWTEWSDDAGGHVWREDRIAELLRGVGDATLYVSGAVSNQGRFSLSFDAVVLLSAPTEVLLKRIAHRTTNDFGKSASERATILRDLADVEPLLRAACTYELDATQPVADVVAQLIVIGAAA